MSLQQPAKQIGPPSQGANIFLGDSDKLGGAKEEERNCFLLICFWPCWVFIAARSFPELWQVAATLSLQRSSFSLRWLLLWSTGSRLTGSVAVAHRLSCKWDLPGFKPASPALAGRLLTTGPPQESLHQCFLKLQSTRCTRSRWFKLAGTQRGGHTWPLPPKRGPGMNSNSQQRS